MLSEDTPTDSTNIRLNIGDLNLSSNTLIEDALLFLSTSETSLLFGSTISSVDVQEADLDKLKISKWNSIKAKCSNVINTNMSTPYGKFQCSPEDRQNISDTVLLAQTITNMGQTFSMSWTLADNSVVTLDLAAMVNVGLLLGAKVQEAHTIARTLRATIDAATTIEEVHAVVWP